MIQLKTMSQSVPWQTSVWNIRLSMLMSASRINDAGILPAFSMPALIWCMNASQRKHNENMQLRPSFVSHKLWNFPEARELDTNRIGCLCGQIGCTWTRTTQTPSVCPDLQVTNACYLRLTLETFTSKRELPSNFFTTSLKWWDTCVVYIYIETLHIYTYIYIILETKPELFSRWQENENNNIVSARNSKSFSKDHQQGHKQIRKRILKLWHITFG